MSIRGLLSSLLEIENQVLIGTWLSIHTCDRTYST
ncbi:hypothetical protein FOFC_17583 [Fusarium oxysporum]|nr:hypothetical protein FOFC_17583 [Fusarium oxysporum]